ncbi:MAG: hypothetical protein P4L84_14585 [Isosphaeraceae bacterium]|nr:hypothetical protein [Isosphaeraceae bacterium]
MKASDERKLWVALAFGLVIGLVNVAKPVHIDDTLYLEVAHRIVTHPLDPYGGILNWQQIPEPTYNVSISPPLLSYWFALVLVVAGENITLLHVSMIPWLLLACWALYRLGERWARAGLITVVLVIGGPAVTAGTNLMLDVPLLACICASVDFLARSESGRFRALVAASAFAAVGVWIKFAALALVPIFLVAALTRRRVAPALAAVGPIAALVGWQWLSRSVYGTSQVGTGLSFLAKLQSSLLPQTMERTLTMMAILATTFPIWLAAPWRGYRAIGPALPAVVVAAVAAWLLQSAPMNRLPAVTPAFLAAVFLGTFGVAAIVRPGRRWPPGELDPRPWLAVWIAAGAAVVILFGPFVAVRSFLPIQPPLAIWLLGGRRATESRRLALGLTLGVTLVLGGLLAATDLRWAHCYPAAVRQIAPKFARSQTPVDFLGHWGWQYYAERAGFRAWDARRRNAPDGTVLVIPLRADKQYIDPAVLSRARLLDRITFPCSPLRLTTWNRQAGFRFYGGDFGQLPWGFSSEPTERFFVYEISSAGFNNAR